jgi:hypothetical protein
MTSILLWVGLQVMDDQHVVVWIGLQVVDF